MNLKESMIVAAGVLGFFAFVYGIVLVMPWLGYYALTVRDSAQNWYESETVFKVGDMHCLYRDTNAPRPENAGATTSGAYLYCEGMDAGVKVYYVRD